METGMMEAPVLVSPSQGHILTAAQIRVGDPCSLHPSLKPGGQLQVGVQGHTEMGMASPEGKCDTSTVTPLLQRRGVTSAQPGRRQMTKSTLE